MSDLDRFAGPLRAFIRQAMARVDYLAHYPARVVAQNADGTLELRPDTDRLPGLSKVPIRYGIPGVRAEVAAGTRVHVVFENGDPRYPVAVLWELAGATLVFNGGTQKVARVGDEIEVTLNPADITTMALSNAGGPVVATNPVTVTGTITSGADQVKA